MGQILSTDDGKTVTKTNPLPIGTNYQDLKLVVEGTNMAAGSFVNSPWYDNTDWVRNIIVTVASDQNYSVVLGRRDSDLANPDSGQNVASNQTPSTTGRPHMLTNTIPGYSHRWSLQNSAAVPNTYARARVQLLGL